MPAPEPLLLTPPPNSSPTPASPRLPLKPVVPAGIKPPACFTVLRPPPPAFSLWVGFIRVSALQEG